MSRILVIGCVSLDTIHLETVEGEPRRTIKTIGGAALYTALAAAKVGAEVTLFAPKPYPVPDIFKPVETFITWIGPTTSIEQMPTLEIVHHGNDRATLLHAEWGAECLLLPEQLKVLVDTHFDITHIAALSTPARQLDFIRYLKATKSNQVLSAGTYARAIQSDMQAVKTLLDECDAFFMNKNEAALLFGTSEIPVKEFQLIFITDGAQGVDLHTCMPDLESMNSEQLKEGIQASHSAVKVEHVPTEAVDVSDPTGAGDSFCGAALAGLTIYISPQAAAQVGVLVASKSIEYEGPSIYFMED